MLGKEPPSKITEQAKLPLVEPGFPDRVPDLERDEDNIRVRLDNAILTKLRVLQYLPVFPSQDSGRRTTALEWLNLQGVFSVTIDDRQVPCRFIVRGRAGTEVICMIDTQKGKSFVVSSTGVKPEMQLCIYVPTVFDQLAKLALEAQKKFSDKVEIEINRINDPRSRTTTDFSLDVATIGQGTLAVTSLRMQSFARSLLTGERSYRQVITPEPEMAGSCTDFFNWLGGQIKSNKLTPAARFENEQLQIALVGLDLKSDVYGELIEKYTKTFGTLTTALFPSLKEVTAIVNNFLPNFLTETIEVQGKRGRVQRTKLDFGDLRTIQSLVVDERMPRIRFGKSLVDISDDSRVMSPTIYISF